MTGPLTRRDTLRICAAGLALPLGALGLGAIRGAPVPVQWTGTALGGLASMTLWHSSERVARRAIDRLQVEIDRLENIFSLHRPESEISRLNREGGLLAPSPALLEVLDQSRRVADQSGGAFDPTIQPLWQLFAAKLSGEPPLNRMQLTATLARVDYTALSATARAIRLGRTGMAVSLNGIAQGYMTDRVTELLGNEGFEHAVIELGETRALGSAPDGTPFAIGLVDPAAPATLDRDVALANASLSVSGGYGTPLGAAGRHHIFDPRTGESAMRLSRVAVISPKAVWADALSTAIYVAGEDAAPALLAAYPASRAILTRRDGSGVEL
ncbi:FAD:protein FMN transferase [Sinisalibacter aestuarii]|uniref:FAD:protein FMN transferase n=1 Tax=Sinisalibacter aestuarii TaxID=2949426 RepID=A0ABQ5LYU2_9RHOB|nr:FAD:protein FMN transferase [Sinisalibacter aestuarii]GKY89571.1 FAD:protein FMN transferase [Sinisalibacter aestuarii]